MRKGEKENQTPRVVSRATDLVGPQPPGRALQVLVHTIQQPEQELQGIVLGIALELRAILGDGILKGTEECLY